jgi:hypothetical protein
VRCINVERDRGCHEQLVRNLAPWPDVAIALRGEFAAHLTDILDTIGDDPALFFLDPFGISGVEMQIIARRGKTELLLHCLRQDRAAHGRPPRRPRQPPARRAQARRVQARRAG